MDFVRIHCGGATFVDFLLPVHDGRCFTHFEIKRNGDEGRLQRELEQLESRQNKLMKKMGKNGVESTAQAQTQPTGEAAQTFSAL